MNKGKVDVFKHFGKKEKKLGRHGGAVVSADSKKVEGIY